METNKIKEYLKDIYTLEWEKYTYQRIDQMYQKRIDYLEKEKNTIYYKDAEDQNKKGKGVHNFEIPAPENKASYLGEQKNASGRCEPVHGFRGTQDMFHNVPERWWNEELKALEKSECQKFRCIHMAVIAACVLIGGAISYAAKKQFGLIVGVFTGMFLCCIIGNEKKKKYLPKDKLYKKFMGFYRRRYNEELRQKAEKYQPVINQMKTERKNYVIANIEKLDVMLCALYGRNDIQKKYQNIIAVTQLYDYLDKQRCTRLEGRAGAYSLFEAENAEGIIFSDVEMFALKVDKYEKSMPSLVTRLKALEGLVNELSPEMHTQKSKTVLKKYMKSTDEICRNIGKKYDL